MEIFAGYSLLPADRLDDFPRSTSHGIQISASANLNTWFGVLADVGVHLGTNRNPGPGFEGLTARTRVVEILVGLRFVARSARANAVVHALVGVARGDAGEDFSGLSDTKLAFGGGGGVDVRLLDRVSLRGQFDLIASFADIVEGNTRFALGLVIGLGQ